MDDKKFKAIREFIKSQSDIVNALIRREVRGYEVEFDNLRPDEKAEYGWDIDDQQAEAEAEANK